MESNYALYIKEREPNKRIIESNKGFATYILNEKECYIVDVFVRKEYRNLGVCKNFVETIRKIAKNNSCDFLTTSVCPTALGSTRSLEIALKCGFILDSSINNLIFFKQDI